MRARYYCGYGGNGGRPEVFKAAAEPTAASHGDRYAAVVGPFRTKRAAVWMATAGHDNPHARCVADAERISKLRLSMRGFIGDMVALAEGRA